MKSEDAIQIQEAVTSGVKKAWRDMNMKRVWWCSTHNREATHVDKYGSHQCDPKLGGILLPCRAELKLVLTS